MNDTQQRDFLNYSAEKLREYTARIEKCLGMLTAEQIWARGSENENAIGNLVLHLCGNVRQWIISSVGGAPDMRQRDAEFAARGGVPAADLAERLRGTVEEAAAVLDRVTSERLAESLLIQGYQVTGMLAIYHVVEHFAGHTGQIIFATKMLTASDLGFYHHLRAAAPHTEKNP